MIAEDRQVAIHQREFNRDHNGAGETIYDCHHYQTVAQRKPGALRNGEPFDVSPESFKSLQKILMRRPGGDREMFDVLSLVLNYDENDVEQAIIKALEIEFPSKEHVVNYLHRLINQDTSQPLNPTPSIELLQEPEANTLRYDQLIGDRHAY
ncbi:MAG: hypothetical protein ACJAS1_001750 [Oleiphilaceae bacterium]|jgi:hypothetical protein